MVAKGVGDDLVLRPKRARAVFVLAHGAGAGMRHAFMTAIAEALAEERIATLRFDFPYMARGSKRIDAAPILEQSIVDAVARARRLRLPLVAGGKSMGGRLASMAAAGGLLPSVRALVFLGYPLHPARRPLQGGAGAKRAEHLARVPAPMLFLQGTRDALADLRLLRPIVRSLPEAKLHVVEGADHGFAVLKTSGRTEAEVLRELSRATAEFLDAL